MASVAHGRGRRNGPGCTARIGGQGRYRDRVPLTRDAAPLRRTNRAAPRAPAARPRLVAGLALGALLAGTGWWALQWHARHHVTLAFTPPAGTAPALELTFYPDRLAFAAPSPPPSLGRQRLEGGLCVTVGRELVPARALVRYRGDGVGAGYLFVQLGAPAPAVPLRPPSTLRGRVGEPIGFWCFGWRSLGIAPVAGAEVVVMGGGEHGIDLATARTDADGSFTVTGFDGRLDGLGLRVRAPGFALAHQPLGRVDDGGGPGVVVALARGVALSGRVDVPPGLDATALRVVARGLPGVDAAPAADGTFVLDHVPAGVGPRLLLHGLPPQWTYLPARATPGVPLHLQVVPAAIVRGRVLDAATVRPLAGALVYCGEQEAVRADEHGCFELPQLLPGDVEITAQWEFVDSRRRRSTWYGRRRVELSAGTVLDDLEILVTAR